jgi:hypothetical protein
MKTISRTPTPFALSWTQPHVLHNDYELRAGTELVGTLRFRSALGTLATGEAGDGTWTFKRVGFWRQALTIRTAGSDHDFAAFHNNTWSGGGTLELPGGRKVRATSNTWQTVYEWSLDSGEVLFRFRMGGVFRRKAEVEVTPAGAAQAELSLLLLLAWYLAIMLANDAAATAATIAAT